MERGKVSSQTRVFTGFFLNNNSAQRSFLCPVGTLGFRGLNDLCVSLSLTKGHPQNSRQTLPTGRQVNKEDFHFARHCEEPQKIIIGFVRSYGDAAICLLCVISS